MWPRETENPLEEADDSAPTRGSVAARWLRGTQLGILGIVVAVVGLFVFLITRANLLVLPFLLGGLVLVWGCTLYVLRCPACGASLWISGQRVEFCPACGAR